MGSCESAYPLRTGSVYRIDRSLTPVESPFFADLLPYQETV